MSYGGDDQLNRLRIISRTTNDTTAPEDLYHHLRRKGFSINGNTLPATSSTTITAGPSLIMQTIPLPRRITWSTLLSLTVSILSQACQWFFLSAPSQHSRTSQVRCWSLCWLCQRPSPVSAPCRAILQVSEPSCIQRSHTRHC